SATSTSGAPGPRFLVTAVWTGSKVVFFGGAYATTILNTGGIYDPAADTWSSMTTTGAPSIRVYHSAVWADTAQRMVVWGCTDVCGGRRTGYAARQAGGRYAPATDTLSAVTAVTAPDGRAV